MQIRAIVLYNRSGDRRVVGFRLGELNIVTGISQTGKSALLDIVEFCLGRRTVTMPVGPITESVAWYGVLLELPNGGRAFVARPAPRHGAATSSPAMLEVGTDLEVLDYDELAVNANASNVREQLGRLVGIEENLHEPEIGSPRDPLEANLGHALLLCFQGQGEIANRDLLFHRQGGEGISRAIQDTLPYFIGAVPADQTLKRRQLGEARRDLRRAEADLQRAEYLNDEAEIRLHALLEEAYAKGLVPSPAIDGRAEIVTALQTALRTQPTEPPLDDQQLARRRELERRRSELRQSLRETAEQRILLEEQRVSEQGYEGAVTMQLARLQSVDLMGDGASDGDATSCPICGTHLYEADPTVSELRGAAQALRLQLMSVEAARPRRATALAELSAQEDHFRQQLRATEAALVGLTTGEQATQQARERAEEQAFTKGRIDLYLRDLRLTENQALARLRQTVDLARRRIEQLEADLDPEFEQEQLHARLGDISQDITRYADQLQLEHRGGSVQLNHRRLTVIVDTGSGLARLPRIGSAANWVGYHLVTHLALHRYLVRNRRPVPQFLMLDQPTQAYFPSEIEQISGAPADEDDRTAVRRIYSLMRDVVAELAPRFQIIVCDHADLSLDWFQRAVRHNWRGSEKLIPAEWLS